jgi:hypothetical protein
MKTALSLALFAVGSFLPALSIRAADPVDCNCVINLPAITVTCPAVVPDLCVIATNCFGTNLLPGSCLQNPPPGMPVSVGTNMVSLVVSDTLGNPFFCLVPFVVRPPDPAPPLTLACPTNKTVECGSQWFFDTPQVLSSCCGAQMTWLDFAVTNGPCSVSYTRTWQFLDACGNAQTCSQTVTTVDTTPPGGPCHPINLVPNGSFEFATNCANAISLFDYAVPWFTPTSGTTDLYSGCNGQGSTVSAPTNSSGYYPSASGNQHAGAHLYSDFGTNAASSYREYLAVPLVAPLTPGQPYLVSFYVKRHGNWNYAIANIGARFLPFAYTDYGTLANPFTGVLPFAAHIENPATNIITSTNTWTLIQGVYTAMGWETHLYLGNFKDDPSTTAAVIGGGAPFHAYYLFDDVSVVPLCDPGITNKTVACGQPFSLDPFPILDNCAGTNLTVSSMTTTNGTCPTVVERTWFVTDPCGNSNTLTQKVTIVDTNPPVLLCGPGANLVPNPQFENYSTCPYFFSQVPLAAPWFNPTVATPDYFNTCATFWPVGVPGNWFGNQTPYSGNGYMGAFVYSVHGTNPVPGYREYIEAPLLAPLQAGVTYQVSFRVSLADFSGWAISEIGAHFSTGPVLNGATQGPLNVIPQVVNPPSSPLTVTNGWMLVQGTFTAAGGEDHITLGNFLDDASTTAVPAAGTNHAYYYFDDVVVAPVCALVSNKTVLCGQPWTFDPPTALDDCSGTNVTLTVLGTVTNGPCPASVQRTWALTDACGNTTTWSQTVTIVDNTPPSPFCTAPNLVPNGGFEFNSTCPSGLSQLNLAAPWYPATDGSPDAYNSCAPPNPVGVPTNVFGVQPAFEGQGYAGAYLYSLNQGTNLITAYREYLQVPLIAPLVANQTYPVSFRVCLAELSGQAIADIGAHFSVGPLTNYNGFQGVLNVTPQVVNPPTNVITSTNSWVLIQGTYTAAGGETHLTLGNFKSDAATTALPGPGALTAYAYYYIDDVRVGPPCPPLPPEKVVLCGQPLVFDTLTGYDDCSGTNITITSADVTNSACPLIVSRTWTLTDLCGNSTNVSQTLFVTDPVPPVVDIACLMTTLESLLFTNGCPAVIPNLAFLTNSPCITENCGSVIISQSPPPGAPANPGVNPITLAIADCQGNSTNLALNFVVNPPPPGGLSCPPNLYLVACSNGFAVAHYTVAAFGNLGPVTSTPPSGSVFPIGTNVVVCSATNTCGQVVTCSFNVIVRPPRLKWDCVTKHIVIKTTPMGTALVRYPPDYGDDSGPAIEFFNLGNSGEDGARLEFGPAETFAFTTVLDFTAPPGARVDLRIPPGHGDASGRTLLTFVRGTNLTDSWEIHRPRPPTEPPTNLYRAIAVDNFGTLFDSIALTAAELDTNLLSTISPMNGQTNAVVTVTLDARTHGLTIGLPNGNWSPLAAGRKGWDGCIYGPDRPRPKPPKTSRLIFTPSASGSPVPLTGLDLVTSNLTVLAFENPTLSARENKDDKWRDRHVTLLKAFDDGTEAGVELVSFGGPGGAQVDLGHAADFQFRLRSLDNGPVANPEYLFRLIGWPPGTTTNRPPPPTNYWRLAAVDDGSGVPVFELAADFTQWGVSNVTVQLWNGSTLVAQTNRVPATLAGPLASLGAFPEIMGSPALGVLSLARTNPFPVANFPGCGGVCTATEVRVLAELEAHSTPPTAYTGLEFGLADGMAMQVLDLQTTPACVPTALHVARTSSGITLTWAADGFRLQGAERVTGPWYDLGVNSPVTLPAGSTLRLFRLKCD